jgi:hypothetical protein
MRFERRAAAVCLVWLCLGCGGARTRIFPLTGAAALQTALGCERVFPHGAFEVTHVVEASIPFSDDTSLIGVVAAEANHKQFRSLLLTQEGIVIFDAVRRGAVVEVVRALPPIDPEGFGRAMTDDVKLVLLLPDGSNSEVGRTEQGIPICRWTNGAEQVEVQLTGQHEARIARFRQGAVVRNAWLKDIDDRGFARDTLLETTSIVGYQLHLTLLNGDLKTTANAREQQAGSNGEQLVP